MSKFASVQQSQSLVRAGYNDKSTIMVHCVTEGYLRLPHILTTVRDSKKVHEFIAFHSAFKKLEVEIIPAPVSSEIPMVDGDAVSYESGNYIAYHGKTIIGSYPDEVSARVGLYVHHNLYDKPNE